MPFLAPFLPFIIAGAALGGLGVGIHGAVDEGPEPPTPEDPRIAEARRRRAQAEGRGRGRGGSTLGRGGGGGAATTSAPSLLGGTQ